MVFRLLTCFELTPFLTTVEQQRSVRKSVDHLNDQYRPFALGHYYSLRVYLSEHNILCKGFLDKFFVLCGEKLGLTIELIFCSILSYNMLKSIVVPRFFRQWEVPIGHICNG